MNLNYNLKTSLVRRVNYVTHIGKRRNVSRGLHTHACYGHEMIYVDYGRIVLVLDGEEVILSPGECIFIRGGTTHSFKGEDNMPFNYLNIMFRGTLPDNFFSHVFNVDRKMRLLFEELREESLHENKFGKDMIGTLLTELVIRLLRHLESPFIPHMSEPEYRQNYMSETVEKVMRAISENYSCPLTLSKLGRAVGVSESHLRLLIRKETGKNFSTLIQSVRIEAAKRLLLEGAMPINGIAAAVGYSSPVFFFKIFKRITGMTPKTYAVSLGDSCAEENR